MGQPRTSGVVPPLTEPIDLLLVDDELDVLEPASRFFQRQGYRVAAATGAEQALALQANQAFHVAVIDQNMPDMNGLQLMDKLITEDPDLKVIMLTGGGSISSAVEAMKLGAIDYLTKPFGLSDLDLIIRKASRTRHLERENQHLRQQLARKQGSTSLVGHSSAMQEVARLIARVAPSTKPVLIQGESGTGKELVARAIHQQSTVAKEPLVVINCAALPETLLESELFGYEKGAFTGAQGPKPGLFEIADGGTLFIDEFGELAGSLQAKLLRVLEDGSLRRIGSVRERRVKVRLIAATNRNLAAEVAAGRFREDLYYRVNVLSINLPPLRERNGDIPLLVHHFVGDDWELEPGVMELFQRAPWPGNVRQLLNAIERAKILADDHVIRIENLPADLKAQLMNDSVARSTLVSGNPTSDLLSGDVCDLATLSKRHVLEVLKLHHGNKARAARALGIARRSLYRLLERFERQAESTDAHG
jgi:DNA-binding NtrC family response regulator